MLRSRLKPIAIGLIAMQMAWSSPPVLANALRDALDGMFITSSTDFRAYDNQARSGLVGGGASIRAPIKSVTLLQFDPPRYNASCGGIDMFAGAFSFINTDQLVQLFRAVAANAVAVLFKAAIEAISPQIGGLMGEFESKIRQLNSLMKNSCQIANQILNPSTDVAASITSVQGKLSDIVTKWGDHSDMFKTTSKFFEDPAGSFKAALSKVTNPSTGQATSNAEAMMRDTSLPWNTTWQMLSDSQAERFIGNPLTGGSSASPVFTRRVLLSLVGTYIGPNAARTASSPQVSQPPSETAAGGTAAPTTTNKDEVTPAKWYEPVLSISQFIDGGTQVTLWQCTDDEKTCLKMDKEENVTLPGLRSYTHRMLFGSSDPQDRTVVGGSIVDKIVNCSGPNCQFTADQKSFIAAVPVPTLKYLRDVQGNSYAVYAVAGMLEPLIVNALAERYLGAALRAIRLGVSGHNSVTPHPDVLKRLTEIEGILMELRKAEKEKVREVLTMHEYVDSVRKTNSAILVAPAKR